MDFRINPKLFWSVSCDVHRMYAYSIGQYFLDAALGMKYRQYGRSSQVAFQPGVLVGYGRLAVVRSRYTVYLDPTDYLTLKTTLEVIFFSRNQAAFFAELGALWAPVGGDIAHRIRIGPMALIRGGVML